MPPPPTRCPFGAWFAHRHQPPPPFCRPQVLPLLLPVPVRPGGRPHAPQHPPGGCLVGSRPSGLRPAEHAFVIPWLPPCRPRPRRPTSCLHSRRAWATRVGDVLGVQGRGAAACNSASVIWRCPRCVGCLQCLLCLAPPPSPTGNTDCITYTIPCLACFAMCQGARRQPAAGRWEWGSAHCSCCHGGGGFPCSSLLPSSIPTHIPVAALQMPTRSGCAGVPTRSGAGQLCCACMQPGTAKKCAAMSGRTAARCLQQACQPVPGPCRAAPDRAPGPHAIRRRARSLRHWTPAPL